MRHDRIEEERVLQRDFATVRPFAPNKRAAASSVLSSRSRPAATSARLVSMVIGYVPVLIIKCLTNV